MQYVSALFGLTGSSSDIPSVFLFDGRDGVDVRGAETIQKGNEIAYKARAVLGLNGYLNPVRGRKDNKYYFTTLKYAWPVNQKPTTDMDVVSLPSPAVISGVCSYAETNTFTPVSATHKTTVLGYGSDNATIHPGNVVVGGTNGPYNQRGDVLAVCDIIDDSGAYRSITCNPAPYIVTATIRQTITPSGLVPKFKYAQPNASLSFTSITGTGFPEAYVKGNVPSYDVYQDQIGEDESVMLDSGMFYWPGLKSMVHLNSDDFDSAYAKVVPGTRPKFRFKATKLLI